MEEAISKQQTGEVCIICEEEKPVGIHICHQFICQSCEQRIVHTETNDALYTYYLNKLRKLQEAGEEKEKSISKKGS